MMKEIPKSIEIEEVVIASLMISKNGLMEAMPHLRSSDIFYEIKHQMIFEAIDVLYSENKSVDLITVSQQLKQNGNLETVGGEYALIQLTQKIASTANIEHHCFILLQYFIKRKIIEKANNLLMLAYRESTDSIELLEIDSKMTDTINDIVFSGKKEQTYADALDKVVERVELLSRQEPGEFLGIPTGYPVVDRFTGGWQNSDLIVIAARPGMGKTAFVLRTLVVNALRKNAVGMFSLEMSTQQLAARTVAINSNFHLSQLLKKGFDKPKYFNTLNLKKHEMQQLPIYIDDTPALDIRDLITKARIWHRKHHIKLLIVDYMQLVQDKSKGNNREQEIASIARNLKMLAKELDVPVIALSQLSRSVETRVDKRPRLSDLRESGAIEQDADVVTFLYREHYYNPEADLPREIAEVGANAEFSFAKYRHGSLETIPLYFSGDKVKYMDPNENNHYDNEEDADYIVAKPLDPYRLSQDENPF